MGLLTSVAFSFGYVMLVAGDLIINKVFEMAKSFMQQPAAPEFDVACRLMMVRALHEIAHLKKILLTGCLALALTGCTFTGANEIAPGQYMITSHGSIFNSREGMLENINQKAAKVCNGKPYHLEGDSGANMVITTPTQIGNTPTTVLGLKAICENSTK